MGHKTQKSRSAHRAKDVKRGMVFLGTRGLDSTAASYFTRRQGATPWRRGQALTQLATYSVKLSIKAADKAGISFLFFFEKKKKCSPSADTPWAAYSGILQKLKAGNEASGTPLQPAQRDLQTT